VARSTGLGGGSPDDAPVVTGTCSSFRTVQGFGIAAHTMTLSATYRLELFSDTGLTTRIYDSGSRYVWPSVYTYAGRSWYTPGFWTGQYSPAEIAGQVPFLPILLDEPYLIKGFRLSLLDADNPAGYLDVGFLEIAQGWQPSSGIEYGAQSGYRFYTLTDTLPGGLKRHDVYQPSFVFNGQIPYLNEDEVQDKAMELYRQLGVHTPFMFVLSPSRPRTWLRAAKMVNLVDPGLLTHAAPGLDAVPFNLEEYKG